MQLYYALYDSAEFTDGNYWTWSAPEIRALLNKFYGDVAAKHLPPKPNDPQNTDLWGGLVRLADWTVVYRYFDGNRDKIGRPQRYVLLTAWIPAADAQRVDLVPIFNNETFQHVAENAEDIPVPPPFAMKENWTAEKITADALQEGEKSFNNLEQAMRSFASVPSNRQAKFEIAHLKIIRTTKEQKFVLNVVPEPKPESKPKQEHPTPQPEPPVPDTTGGKNPEKQKPSNQSLLDVFAFKKLLALLIKSPTLPIVGLLVLCAAWFLGALPNANNRPSPAPIGPVSKPPEQRPTMMQPPAQHDRITKNKLIEIKDFFQTLPHGEMQPLIDELQQIVDRESRAIDNNRPRQQSKPEHDSSSSSTAPVSPRSNTLMEWWSAFLDTLRGHH